MALLPPAARGVVTHSSGNHAGALALAARLHGLRAVVAMPHEAPLAKVAAAERFGAEVVVYDRFGDDRVEFAERLAEERGLALVRPFDDPHVIAGQGTTALELLTDAPDRDALIVPVSGGGLLAGCALVAEAHGVPVIGVEPEVADDFARSLAAGRRIEIEQPVTIADGLCSTAPGELTSPIAQRLVQEIVTVTEDEIRIALRFLFERLKLLVEPSGAVGLAALLAGKVRPERPAVVLTGGNVGIEPLAALTRRPEADVEPAHDAVSRR